MTDLQTKLGIPVRFDEVQGIFHFGEGVVVGDKISVAIADMQPVLLNRSIQYPEHVYQQCKTVSRVSTHERGKQKVSCDLFHVPQGLLGIEFNRTHIFTSTASPGIFACFVEVIEGEL